MTDPGLPSREEVVAGLHAAGLEPEIVVEPAVFRPNVFVQGPDAANPRYNIYETTLTYAHSAATPYMPGDVADALLRGVAGVLPHIVAPRVAIHLAFVEELPPCPDGAPSGVAKRDRPRIAKLLHTPRDLLGPAVRQYVLEALEREDKYDKADNVDFVADWEDGDPERPNRLGGVALVIREYRVPGGGARLSAFSTRSVASFDVPDELCGQACLAYHALAEGPRKEMKRSPVRALNEARRMAARLGVPGRMAVTDFERFLVVDPAARLVVFDKGLRVIYDSGRRTPYPRNAYFLLEDEHYAYIRAAQVEGLLKGGSRALTKWCGDCLALVPERSFRTHCCARGRCSACGAEFAGDAEREAHLVPAPAAACAACLRRLPFAGCAAAHVCEYFTCPACRRSGRLKDRAAHVCGAERCRGCGEQVPVGAAAGAAAGHRCFIPAQRPPRPGRKARPFYAYDIEATIDAEGRHAIALMVAKELYAGAGGVVVLRGAAEVTAWLDEMRGRGRATLVAHNAAEYDAPLLYQALCERPGPKPRDLVFAGEKLVYMAYGGLRFIDSRRHVAGSLEGLARTFHLAGCEKGFFPYPFFTPANRDYVGPVPARSFFPQAGAPGFDAWYAAFEGPGAPPYDIAAECERYCRQDVHILASALEVYQREALELNGLDPLKHATIAAYAQAVYRTRFMPPGSIPQLSREEHDFARPALAGGRTEAFALFREWGPDDVAAGRFGRYVDVNSMYPAVQLADPLPGAVRGRGGPLEGAAALAFVAAHSGAGPDPALAILEYDIDPPGDLYLPVLVAKAADGRLNATLDPLRGARGTSVEVARALAAGYTGLRIHAWMAFNARVDLFADYVRRFAAVKERHAPGGAEPNPGKAQIAKLMLNSLWGKFAQRDPAREYFLAQDEARWYEDVARYHRGGAALEVVRDGGSYLLCARELAAGTSLHLHTTNVALAAFVTAHARLRLYALLDRLGPRALYCDTDSVVFAGGPGLWEPPTSARLGEWKDECPGDPIVKFVALAPKTWAFRTASGKEVVKCKGFPASWASLDLYERLVRGTQACEVNEVLAFSRSCKASLGVRTYTATRRLTYLYLKRAVVGFETLPFGWRGPPCLPGAAFAGCGCGAGADKNGAPRELDALEAATHALLVTLGVL